MESVTDDSALCERKQKQGAAGGRVKCEGVVFALTEDNGVALVTKGKGGATHALGSENYLDAITGTRRHFVDVQGKAEAMLFQLVSGSEDQRRIV